MKRYSVILGTRPEAIKLCPVILAMREQAGMEAHICTTGQHRQMLDDVLQVFEIKPHLDLKLMVANQTLSGFASRAINALDAYIVEYKPDMVIVQGDTTTTFCAALAAFHRKIPVAHVEAGLRTWNKNSPFPEEINRVMTSHLASLHFAPTHWARENLLREGISKDTIFVTGNTVIDALKIAIDKIERDSQIIAGIPQEISFLPDKRIVLITGHRRESFGEGFRHICSAIRQLAKEFPTVGFVYPVHLNPNVRKPVFEILSGCHNVHLIEPLSYLQFVALMYRSTIILTDSGGIQEEAPSLGKPVLVMREITERPEGIEAGIVRLIGTQSEKIVAEVRRLLTDEALLATMAKIKNPYGDGSAAHKIIQICAKNAVE